MEREDLTALGIGEEAAEKVMEMNEAMRGEYEKKLAEIKREAEIREMLRESGARNVKAARAMLEGCDGEDFAQRAAEQIAKMKRGSETSFLFEEGESFKPGYSSERLPEVKKDGFEAKLREARERRDTVAAIRIKQAAAEEGVILM